MSPELKYIIKQNRTLLLFSIVLVLASSYALVAYYLAAIYFIYWG